jgi:hypothetical protein
MLDASIGVAVGEIMFDPAKAANAENSGRSVILVRGSLATEDIAGIAAAAGVDSTSKCNADHFR